MKKSSILTICGVGLIYFMLLCKGSLTRYEFYEQEGDLAAYDNAIYHTAQGDWFQSTVSGSVTRFWTIVGTPHPPYPSVPDDFHLAGIHANWALALTNAPWTYLCSSPKTSLILQTSYIAITGILMGLLFLSWGLPLLSSVLVVAGFFLHPATIGANLNAFHPIVMAMPFIVLFLIAFQKNKRWLMILSSIVICFTQENAILTAMALSLMPALKKQYKFALIHLFATTLCFVWMTNVVVPHFNESHVLPYGHLYGSPLGASMEEIVKNGIRHPITLLQTVLTYNKIRWLFLQLICFFPVFFAPAYILVGLVGLAPNLLSTNPSMLLFWGQYNAMGFPLFVIGAGAGLNALQARSPNVFKDPKRFNLAAAVIPIVAILVFWATVNDVPANHPSSWLFRSIASCSENDRCKDFKDVESKIPPDASLSATDFLLTHVSHRKRAYIFPVEMLNSDISILEKNLPWWKKDVEEAFLRQLVENGYVLDFENPHFKLYRKK